MLFVIMSELAALIVFAVRVVAYIIRFFLDLFPSHDSPLDEPLPAEFDIGLSTFMPDV